MAISSSVETKIKNYDIMMRDLISKSPELAKQIIHRSTEICWKFKNEPYFGLLWASCVMNLLMKIYSGKEKVLEYKTQKLADFYEEWLYLIVELKT